MTTASPKITEARIIGWVGPTYAERGRNYFRSGHVVDIRWRGATLTGRVQGSEPEPYRVRIQFDGRALDGDCSCPVGFNCKHVAAVLYAQMSAPARTRRSAPLEKQLAGLDKPALVRLIVDLVDEAPELEDVVEAEVAAAGPLSPDAKAVQARVEALLAAVDARASERLGRAVERWVGEARARLKAGRPAEAWPILHALFAGALQVDALDQDPDWKPALKALADCWRALPETGPARGDALRLLYEILVWNLGAGVGKLAALIEKTLVKHARPAERDQVREWIALAERLPPATRRARRKPAWELDDLVDYGDFDDDDDAGLDKRALARLSGLARSLAGERAARKPPARKPPARRSKARAGRKRGVRIS